MFYGRHNVLDNCTESEWLNWTVILCSNIYCREPAECKQQKSNFYFRTLLSNDLCYSRQYAQTFTRTTILEQTFRVVLNDEMFGRYDVNTERCIAVRADAPSTLIVELMWSTTSDQHVTLNSAQSTQIVERAWSTTSDQHVTLNSAQSTQIVERAWSTTNKMSP